MTIGERLCKKYGLTSSKVNGGQPGTLAIDEALESCAEIADNFQVPEMAHHIRTLKPFSNSRNEPTQAT